MPGQEGTEARPPTAPHDTRRNQTLQAVGHRDVTSLLNAPRCCPTLGQLREATDAMLPKANRTFGINSMKIKTMNLMFY